MAKAKRLLSAQLSKVDLVVELCDARLPQSSRNPALDELIRHKRRVLLLCKADLAEPAKTQRWLAYFRRQGLECMAYDKSPQKTKQARALIELTARDVLERNQRRGIQKTLRAMVVGVPTWARAPSSIACMAGASPGRRPPRRHQEQPVGQGIALSGGTGHPRHALAQAQRPAAATRLAYIGTIKDAVYDQYELCACLLADLMAVMPEQTIERYKIKDPSAQGYALLDEVCRGRGFLMRGGVCDLDRACAVILDEFREGKVGKLTLEDPPQTGEEAHDGKTL